MHVINARNVNDAYTKGLAFLTQHGEFTHSRNGAVIVSPVPVTTVYEKPWERVLFDEARDANPYFHFMESLWMLAGRDDVDTVARYVSRMRTFSDDGVTLHGAYGYRWRKHFWTDDGKIDQLAVIIELLDKHPDTRRAVLTMWDPHVDIARWDGKDVPCNTQAYFWIDQRDRTLNMTITCRSNDIIWGAYGANAVHFSFLQEYIACALRLKVGQMWQVSNNFHAYKDLFIKTTASRTGTFMRDPYGQIEAIGNAYRYPLFVDRAQFDQELQWLFSAQYNKLKSYFFTDVAAPIKRSHLMYKEFKNPDRFLRAKAELSELKEFAPDWLMAIDSWLDRREAEHNRAKDDGVPHS